MCVTDRHDMTLAVKLALNPNTTDQQTNIEMTEDIPERREDTDHKHLLLFQRPHKTVTFFTGDSARIQDETTESSTWFFNVSGYSTVTWDLGLKSHPKDN